jgi:type II secretory pathway component PulJ
MDSALILVTIVRMMRDYQQTIDALQARVAELEAAQRSNNGVARPAEVADATPA